MEFHEIHVPVTTNQYCLYRLYSQDIPSSNQTWQRKIHHFLHDFPFFNLHSHGISQLAMFDYRRAAIYCWLVVSTPLKNSEKYQSLGMLIPNIWKNKSHVPNHQPDD